MVERKDGQPDEPLQVFKNGEYLIPKQIVVKFGEEPQIPEDHLVSTESPPFIWNDYVTNLEPLPHDIIKEGHTGVPGNPHIPVSHPIKPL